MSKAACHGRWFSLSSQGFTEHRLLPRGLNSSLAALARSLAPTHPAHLSQLTRAISHEDSATKIRLSPPTTLCWHSLPWRVRRGNGLVEVGVFCGRRVMGAGQARARPKQEHALAHVPPAGVGRGRGGCGAPLRTHTHRHKTRVASYGIYIFFSIQCLSSVSDPRDKPDNKQATTKENTTGRRNDGKYQGFRSPGGIRQPLSSGRQPISAARRDTSRGMARTKGISFPLSVAAAHSIKIIL